jgi:hypothetical protein
MLHPVNYVLGASVETARDPLEFDIESNPLDLNLERRLKHGDTNGISVSLANKLEDLDLGSHVYATGHSHMKGLSEHNKDLTRITKVTTTLSDV